MITIGIVTGRNMKHLPGLQVLKADIFNLKIGTKIYDKGSKRSGTISSIKDIGGDYIAAFILLDGDSVELQAHNFPQAVIVG